MQAFRKTWMWPFVLLSIPSVLWALYALAQGYTLEGDNAHIAIRTFDMFSSNPPLLGMPSTAGNEVAGTNAFHPGPLQFVLLSPFYALSGFSTWGMMLGSLSVNLGLLALGLWAAWRIDSPWVKHSVVTAFAIVTLLLQALLYSPWNPFPVVVGALTLTVLLWGVLVGVRNLWPLVILVASLVLQAHLVGLILVGTIALSVVVLGMWFRWIARPSLREILLSVVTLIACWALPVWETVTNWPGNVGEILGYVLGSQARESNASVLGGPFELGAVLTIAVLGVAALLGFRRSLRAFAQDSRGLNPGERQVVSIGLFLTSSVVLASGVVHLVIDNPRGPYLWMFAGVWLLQLLLLKPRTSTWWTKWSRSTFAVGTVLTAVTVVSVFAGLYRMAEGIQNVIVVAEAHDLIAPYAEVPIVVFEDGHVISASTGMAVTADLIVKGHTVYYDHFGGRADYDVQRRIELAPDQHLGLYIIQQREDESWPETGTGTVIDTRDLVLPHSKVNIRLVLTRTN